MRKNPRIPKPKSKCQMPNSSDTSRMAARKSKTMKMRKGSKKSKTMKKKGGLSPALSDWNKRVMAKYHEMKKNDPSTRLGDAMKALKGK